MYVSSLQPQATKNFSWWDAGEPKISFHDCHMVFLLQIRVGDSLTYKQMLETKTRCASPLSPLIGRNETPFLLVRHLQFTANYKILCLYLGEAQ